MGHLEMLLNSQNRPRKSPILIQKAFTNFIGNRDFCLIQYEFSNCTNVPKCPQIGENILKFTKYAKCKLHQKQVELTHE